MAELEEILEGRSPTEPDPVDEAMRGLEPGDVEGARRVIEAAKAQHGRVPDVVVASLLDMFPNEAELEQVWRMVERAGWSGGPIQ